MHKLIFFKLFLIISTVLNAETVFISGTSSNFAEKPITVFQYSDPYSEFPVELAAGLIDSEGQFKLSFEIDQTSEIFLRVSWFTSRIYVEPGTTYSIELAGPGSGQLISFHKEALLEPVFFELSQSDPNFQIAKFNQRYERFFEQNYVEIAKARYPGSNRFKKSRRNKSQDLMVGNDSLKIDTVYAGMSFKGMVKGFGDSVLLEYSQASEFVKTYVEYVLADLELSSGHSRKEVFEKYLANRELDILHPEFGAFAHSFYFNFLEDLELQGRMRSVRTSIEQDQSLDSLKLALDGSGFCSNEELKELALSVALKHSLSSGSYSKAGILSCLTQLSESGNPPFREINTHLLQHLQSRRKGAAVPEVRLMNVAGERISWDEFKGKLSYVVVMANWCSSCVEELVMLEKISSKYSREVEFVILSMDEDYSDFKDFVSRNHRNKWTFVYGMSDPFIRERMNIWSLPSYFLISPDLSYLNPFEKAPSEGVEEVFYRLKMEVQKGNKIKVWDD